MSTAFGFHPEQHTPAEQPAPGASVAGSASGSPRRRRALVAGAAIVAVVVMAVGGYVAWSAVSGEEPGLAGACATVSRDIAAMNRDEPDYDASETEKDDRAVAGMHELARVMDGLAGVFAQVQMPAADRDRTVAALERGAALLDRIGDRIASGSLARDDALSTYLDAIQDLGAGSPTDAVDDAAVLRQLERVPACAAMLDDYRSLG